MTSNAVKLVGIKVVFGASLAIGFATMHTASATPAVEGGHSASCVDDGNRICQPGNTEGKPAACYDDGGVIVAEWPCNAWKPSDGYQHDGLGPNQVGQDDGDDASVILVSKHHKYGTKH